MAVNIRGRNFIALKDFTQLEIRYLLELARDLKEKSISGVCGRLLEGRNIILIFEKPSTRTRCAFEVAAREEGAAVSFLENSHLGIKESIEDTAQVLGRYYDGIEFRGYEQSTIESLAKFSGIPVWNGLTNNFHPTQALADALTIMEHVDKPLSKVKLVFVGDARNNVCNSLMVLSAKMGMQFVGLGPAKLFPDKNLFYDMQKESQAHGGSLFYTDDIHQAVYNADVIYTDVWASMGEEALINERVHLLQPYQVNLAMLEASGNASIKFMHCLPACHDTETEFGKKIFEKFGLKEMEVTDEVFRSRYSIVFDQAENRLHTIKAVMVATIGNL